MASRICKKKADIELGTFEASVIHIEQWVTSTSMTEYLTLKRKEEEAVHQAAAQRSSWAEALSGCPRSAVAMIDHPVNKHPASTFSPACASSTSINLTYTCPTPAASSVHCASRADWKAVSPAANYLVLLYRPRDMQMLHGTVLRAFFFDIFVNVAILLVVDKIFGSDHVEHE